MKVLLWFFAIWMCAFSIAHSKVQVKVKSKARFQESETTSTTTQTIVGPKGTRRVYIHETGESREYPGGETFEGDSEVVVDGVNDPGIRVERKVYYPGAGSPQIVGPEVKGGPGSIRTKVKRKTKRLPDVQLEVE